jgi:hypothetical protein
MGRFPVFITAVSGAEQIFSSRKVLHLEGYYKRNRHFKRLIETEVLLI